MVRHDRIRKCDSEYCRLLDDSDREMGRLSHVRITYHEQGSGKEKHFSCSYAPGLAAEMTEFFDKSACRVFGVRDSFP